MQSIQPSRSTVSVIQSQRRSTRSVSNALKPVLPRLDCVETNQASKSRSPIIASARLKDPAHQIRPKWHLVGLNEKRRTKREAIRPASMSDRMTLRSPWRTIEAANCQVRRWQPAHPCGPAPLSCAGERFCRRGHFPQGRIAVAARLSRVVDWQ